MKLFLKVWKQDGPENEGRFESHVLDGVSEDSSFLERVLIYEPSANPFRKIKRLQIRCPERDGSEECYDFLIFDTTCICWQRFLG